jgi:hypothetical protein
LAEPVGDRRLSQIVKRPGWHAPRGNRVPSSTRAGGASSSPVVAGSTGGRGPNRPPTAGGWGSCGILDVPVKDPILHNRRNNSAHNAIASVQKSPCTYVLITGCTFGMPGCIVPCPVVRQRFAVMARHAA